MYAACCIFVTRRNNLNRICTLTILAAVAGAALNAQNPFSAGAKGSYAGRAGSNAGLVRIADKVK